MDKTYWKRNLAVCWMGVFTTSAGVNLVVPFIPLFIQQLGIKNLGQVEQLSGISFSITFLAAACLSPLWGKLADTRGRKFVMMFTSMGLALVNLLYIFTNSVEMLIVFRLIQGLVSGFNPAANSLIANQTPPSKTSWALATLSTGMMAGTLLGPVIGGYLAEVLGIQNVYILTSAFLFLSFTFAAFFLKEEKDPDKPRVVTSQKLGPIWRQLDAKYLIFALMISVCLINTANQSIEPIVSLYVKSLLVASHTLASHISLFSGIVISATGLGIVLFAPVIGKISDKTDYNIVLKISLICSALVFIPMAFVQNAWELMALRFLLGVTQAGTLPIIFTLLKRNSPDEISGQVFGYNQAFQYMGLVLGPMLGSEISSHFGFPHVFYATSFILILNFLLISSRRMRKKAAV
jgi:MFS family permease